MSQWYSKKLIATKDFEIMYSFFVCLFKKEFFVYDCAGKEMFSDYVQEFVSSCGYPKSVPLCSHY